MKKITLKTIYTELIEIKSLLKSQIDPTTSVQEVKPSIKWTKIGNLEWSEDLGSINWYDAEKKCREAGGRLPTIDEWKDLYNNYKEEVNKMLESSPGSYYWSATTHSYNTQHAWATNLYGYTGYGDKTNTLQVRCVR